MSQIVTGEAVALDLRIARLGSRAVALIIDLLVKLAVVLAVLLLMAVTDVSLDEAAAAALVLGLYILIFLGYPVAMESLWGGRTLGKAAMGLRVVRDDGGPIRFRHALVRGLVGIFAEFPGMSFGIAPIVCALVSARSKRLGDLAAGTVVVQERVPVRHTRAVYMPQPLIPWAQSLDLSRLPDDLALAARQFLDRAPHLNPAAREQVGHSITSAVVASVTPPPPPGTPGWAILSAVLAERRRREEQRVAQQQYAGTPGWQASSPPSAGAGWKQPATPTGASWQASSPPTAPSWQASAPSTGAAPAMPEPPPIPPPSSMPQPSAVPPAATPVPPPEPPPPPDGFAPPA